MKDALHPDYTPSVALYGVQDQSSVPMSKQKLKRYQRAKRLRCVGTTEDLREIAGNAEKEAP